MAKYVQPPEGAEIIVDGVMRFHRKADQSDKGGDCRRRSGKLLKVVEMTELQVGIPEGLIVPLDGS